MSIKLEANALTSLEAVKEELGIIVDTFDRLLIRYINAASAFAESFCKRSFYYEAARVDDVAGPGDVFLVLPKAPIVSIGSVAFDGATIDSDNYSIHDAKAGILYRESGWGWTAQVVSAVRPFPLPGTEEKLYQITYECGWVTPSQALKDGLLTRNLPYDLEDAVIELVASKYRQRGVDRTIKSERLMSYSVTYREENVSPDILDVLGMYSKVGMA